jgi:hypothetical protein
MTYGLRERIEELIVEATANDFEGHLQPPPVVLVEKLQLALDEDMKDRERSGDVHDG